MDTIKCPVCKRDVPIITFGDGYIATCCGKVLYNSKTLK